MELLTDRDMMSHPECKQGSLMHVLIGQALNKFVQTENFAPDSVYRKKKAESQPGFPHKCKYKETGGLSFAAMSFLKLLLTTSVNTLI